MANHPVDLLLTVFGPIMIVQLLGNSAISEHLFTMLFNSHVGTLVHSDSHYFWFLDFHGQHHTDGRNNLNGYTPISDLLVGSYKAPQRYTKAPGWR